jgi:hypothetical protein
MLTATRKINQQTQTVQLHVAPECTAAGVIRIYAGVDLVIDLPAETADELVRLLVLYRTEQQDGAQ